MRWTQTLIPTQKETPADAQIASHQLMLRAGLIRQLTAGAYTFLPLGCRALQKAANIVRQEMDATGAAEILMPALQPFELWHQTGRDVSYGENLMKFKDRHGRVCVLGPTHEEVVTDLVKAYVSSYKQLPLTLYQIQTKFRDEYRPRFGLLRVREFMMKDAYSFHADLETLNKTYETMYAAYERIFSRCGIPYVAVEAESGPIGGSASHEFMAPCDAGEDTLLKSDKGNYAANVEKAETGPRPSNLTAPATGELTKVHTPNLPSIEEVGKFMKVKPRNMLKTMVFQAVTTEVGSSSGAGIHWVVAVVRGDHEVNEAKLKRVAQEKFHVESLQLVDNDAVREEWPIGFVGPDAALRHPEAVLVIDPDAAQGGFWAAGANEIDQHVKHFNWTRECGAELNNPAKVSVTDIRNAVDGDPSPVGDGGTLKAMRGIEIGHVFKLGTRYSAAMEAMFLDEKGNQRPIIMGCYGIGVGRILIAAVESLHDEKGIVWPAAIAPFAVVVTPIKYDGAVKEAADKVYAELNAAGIDTILDDRDQRPGIKFIEADLLGFPLRVTIGDRGLKEGKVEVKSRRAEKPDMIGLDGIVAYVKEALTKL